MGRWIRRLAGLLLLSTAAVAAHADESAITVFAASSLTDVLQEIGRAFTAETQVPVTFSFSASSILARQIEAGAPAQVFVSADQEWMDYAQGKALILPRTRLNVAGNELVLVAAAGSGLRLKIAPGFPLAASLGTGGRLVIGDPRSVPAGKYAMVALTRLGVWSTVEQRVAMADNVRVALNFVSRGEAPLGIVYATDARTQPAVRVLDTFPASSHDAIRYPAAAVAGAGPAAVRFVRYLGGDTAQAIFRRAGFREP